MRSRSLLLAAAVAMGLTAGLGRAMAPSSLDGSPAPLAFGGFGSGRAGKGKGRRPHHSSDRFVAQDKRDARKQRNRARA